MRPRYRFGELIAVKNYAGSIVPKERTEDLSRALKFAAKAFANTYESRRGDKGSDFYVASTRTFVGANNFAVGDIGMIMIGHFMATLLRTPCAGKTIQEWILQRDDLPTGAVASTYFAFPYAGQNLDVSARDVPANYPTNSAEYFTGLSAIIKGLNDTFAVHNEGKWTTVEATQRMNFVRALYLFINSRTNRIAYNSFANYVRDSVAHILQYMVRVLCSDSEELPVVEWLDVTSPFNFFKLLRDPTAMLDKFSHWYHAKLETDMNEVVRKVYQLDLKSLSIDNGVIQMKGSVFDTVIDFVINGALSWSQEAVNFNNQLETLKSCYENYYRYGLVLDHEHSSVVAPSCLKALNYGRFKDFDVKGELIELESQVRFWNKTLQLVIDQFNEFVTAFYENDESQYYFPNVSVRKTVINGITSLYRFDFSSPVRDTFMEMKLIPHARASGKTQYDAEPLGLFNVERGTCSIKEDKYQQPLYQRMLKTHFFGTDELSTDEKQAFIDQFRTYDIMQASRNEWHVEFRPVIYTIMPPSDVTRDLDVYAGSRLRAVPGMEYRRVAIDVTAKDAVENVSLLDLMFAVRYHEAETTDIMEKTYQARLRRFGVLADFMPSYKPVEFPGAKVGAPMYGALLALGGAFGSTQLTQYFAIRPKYFGATITNMVKGSKHKKVALNRKLTLKVPVHPTAVNKDYFDRAVGDVIYTSAETRFEEDPKLRAPFFVLKKTAFDPVAWKGYITAEFTLDLAYDVDFPNATKVFRGTNQVELYLNSGMPGFDSVDSGFDERYCVIGHRRDGKGARVVEDFSEFYSSPLLKGDATETFAACLKNAYLELLYLTEDKADQAKAISDEVLSAVDWMCAHFNLDDSSPISTMQEFYSDKTIGDIKKAFKSFGTKKDRSKVADMYKDVFKVGGDALKQLPDLAHPSYGTLLDSALYGAKKFLRNSRSVSCNLPKLPFTLLKDGDTILKMVNVYATQALNLDEINV